MLSTRPTLRHLLIAPLILATVWGPGLALPCAACLQQPGAVSATSAFSAGGCGHCERGQHTGTIATIGSRRHERAVARAEQRGSCHGNLLPAGAPGCCGKVARYPVMIPARADTAPTHGAMIFATVNANPRPRQRIASAIAPFPPPDIAPPLYLLHATLII